MSKSIAGELLKLGEEDLKKFMAPLIPNVPQKKIIGIRTPVLKTYAKELSKDQTRTEKFLSQLPHTYFEENQVHAFLIAGEKDPQKCIDLIEEFLPHIDNWATCDQLCPKTFKKKAPILLPYIKKWIKSDKTYTVRFAVKMLMSYFLDDEFSDEWPKAVCKIKSQEYYVNMMRAWYFATALCKQYEAVLPYIEEKRLDRWTHNKTIQKAVESYRIPDKTKAYLKTLKQ